MNDLFKSCTRAFQLLIYEACNIIVCFKEKWVRANQNRNYISVLLCLSLVDSPLCYCIHDVFMLSCCFPISSFTSLACLSIEHLHKKGSKYSLFGRRLQPVAWSCRDFVFLSCGTTPLSSEKDSISSVVVE